MQGAPTKRTSLAGYIEAALQSQRDAVHDNVFGGLRLSKSIRAIDAGSQGADPTLVDLLRAVERDPVLGTLIGKRLVSVNISRLIDRETLVIWLLFKAYRDGTQSVLTDLRRLARASRIPVRHIVALDGLSLKHGVHIDRTSMLVPWEQLSDTEHKRRIEEDRLNTFFTRPSAALVHDAVVGRSEVFSGPERGGLFLPQWDPSDLIRCIGLFGGGPAPVARWAELPTWVPPGGISFQTTLAWSTSPPVEWPDVAYRRLAPLYRRFTTLPEHERQHLRIALDRLNKASRPAPIEDRAIDLGIALEALFLSDGESDRAELSFRLAVRAARFLGSSREAREDIFSKAQEIYRLRSRAVHRGALPSTTRGTRTDEVIAAGCVLVAEAARKFIDFGTPNWQRIVLE